MKTWHGIPMRRGSWVVLRALEDAGGFLTLDVLFDVLWGHLRDGGPDDPWRALHQHTYRARKALLGSGWKVTKVHGQGVRLNRA